MNALLAETVMGGELDFHGDDLPHRRKRERRIDSSPGDKNTAAAYVFRVHIALQPKRGRGHMASEFDFNSRTLTPVDGFHFCASTHRNLAPQVAGHNIVNGL